MKRWPVKQADEWYRLQPWLVGCNFIPSTAVNQLEMWQAETYDPATIDRELSWAQKLGFNTLRVFLHDLVWSTDKAGFAERVSDFLGIAERRGMKVMLVFFDDCHRHDPVSGPQPLPISCAHNSGWKQSPGRKLVLQFHDGTAPGEEKARLKDYVQGVLSRFSGDERILMWDLYNEPGQNEYGDKSNELLEAVWGWAHEVRPSQPLTACLSGAVGARNLEVNAARSDVITFHCYEGAALEDEIVAHKNVASGRPVLCTEYMARELGTTFRHSLPLFKKHAMGCYCWGLVAGKTQTIWNHASMQKIDDPAARRIVIRPGDPFPEPDLWFHDIFRQNGEPFDPAEVEFIQSMTGVSAR